MPKKESKANIVDMKALRAFIPIRVSVDNIFIGVKIVAFRKGRQKIGFSSGF